MINIPLVEQFNSFDIISLGIDIEDVSRFRKHILKERQSLLLNDLFTPDELECYSRDFNYFIPLSFVFKEAMFKAIGESWNTSTIDWKEIVFFPPGKNFQGSLKVLGKVEEIFNEQFIHAVYANCFTKDAAAICEVFLLRDPSK